MLTRRTAIGAGLAFASAACVNGGAALAKRTARTRPFDALLVDETVAMPAQMGDFVRTCARRLPVLTIGMDAAGQPGLMRTLGQSRALVGISSGATLFCLERMAWDHGFRLTARCQRASGDLAVRQDIAACLAGSAVSAAAPPSLVRMYRPSRADGVVHVWTMQTSTSRPTRQDI